MPLMGSLELINAIHMATLLKHAQEVSGTGLSSTCCTELSIQTMTTCDNLTCQPHCRLPHHVFGYEGSTNMDATAVNYCLNAA